MPDNKMTIPELNKGTKVYFTGICGSSMNGLAILAKSCGAEVLGSDRNESDTSEYLRSNGITVFIGQTGENVTPDISLLVYTVAVGENNPEILKARSLGIPVIERASFLGILAGKHKFCLAVSGTHGKTTTTAMIASCLIEAGLDPAVHIGGNLPLIGGSVRPSEGDIFLTEACEYQRHLLKLSPDGAVITNVEFEHPDCYRDLEDVKDTFRRFLASLPESGFAVICAQSRPAMDVSSSAKCRIITYGLKCDAPYADYTADSIVQKPGSTEFDVYEKGQFLTHAEITVPGIHNVLNSLASFASCIALGASPSSVASGLSSFSGTGRRFELKYTVNGVRLIDDYAHHPTEISATLDAARSRIQPGSKVIAIFQGHTYSRVRTYLDDFSSALRKADSVYVTDIYAAREPDPGDISGKTITQKFISDGVNARFSPSFSDIAAMIRSEMKPGDIVIALGAGTVNKILDIIASEK